MINISQTFTLTGQAPFTYLFTSSDPLVTFTNSGGTTSSNVISTVIGFPTINSISTSSVALTVVSACGNSITHNVTVNNPCDSFTLSPISHVADGDELTFSAIASTQNCANIDYQWSYDTVSYEVVTQIDSLTGSTLRLRKLQSQTISSVVSLTATNTCNGCTATRSYNLLLCTPVAQPLVFTFTVAPDLTLSPVTKLIENPTGCTGFVPDWSTLAVNIPAGFTTNNSNNILTITPDEDTYSSNSYSGTYNVEGTNGVTSSNGLITINIVSGVGGNDTITIPDSVLYLDCDVVEGDLVNVPINNVTSGPGVVIDWTTFEVLGSPTPSGTISSEIIFLSVNGSKEYIPHFTYTVPAGFSSDTFSFTVADSDGNYMTVTVFTLSECITNPVGVDDAFTVTCGSSTILDVITNDTSADSPIRRNSLVIVTPPTHGSHSVNSVNGNITYQAPEGFSGTDTIEYTIGNVAGGTSETTTITITIICAGVNQSVVVCE